LCRSASRELRSSFEKTFVHMCVTTAALSRLDAAASWDGFGHWTAIWRIGMVSVRRHPMVREIAPVSSHPSLNDVS
jgi:hypothetical protein